MLIICDKKDRHTPPLPYYILLGVFLAYMITGFSKFVLFDDILLHLRLWLEVP